MNNAASNNGWMREMFDSVPREYALLNRILTFGRDEPWRKKALDVIEGSVGVRILDVCTGTGDLALKAALRFTEGKIYAVDFSSGMLARASERARSLGLRNITFMECDCMRMAFPDGYFDYVTISFGFRNLSYSLGALRTALGEMRRVLKDEGTLVMLETSQPANRFVRRIFHLYVKMAVPLMGRLFSGKKVPYAYLGSSIVKFFDTQGLSGVLSSEGFRKERAAPFMFGAISLSVFKKVTVFPRHHDKRR